MRHRSFLAPFLLLALAVIPQTTGRAEPDAAASSASAKSAPAEIRVTSIQQYWRLSPQQKTQPIAFDLECDVTYFDPSWRILFVQDMEGSGAYVPYGGNKFPFKAGQHLMASGTFMPPNADITFEHALVTDKGASKATPVPAAGRLMQTSDLLNRLITFDGYVDSCRLTDTVHLELTLSVDGHSVVAWVPLDTPKVPSNLLDATVHVSGVYNPKLGPDGKFSAIEIMVPGLDALTVLNRLSDDERFKLPVVPIGSLAGRPRTKLVRVAGKMKAQEPGRFIRLRDATGQVDIMTGQTRPCSVDDTVEAVGYPEINGTDWRLIDGLFRAANPRATEWLAPAGDTLRVAASVLELAPEEAAQGRAAWLTGVVTWSDPDSPFFFIQDASGGICVMRGNATSRVLPPGRNVEVRGQTAMGAFAPMVVASRFDKVSEMAMPQAQPVSLEHALTGVEEAQWVEMVGYLRRVHRVDSLNELEVATSAGDFVAVIPASEDVSSLTGAVVRLRGVCTATSNQRRKLTGITLWVPAAANIQVEEPAPKNPFDLPLHSLSSLGQFNSLEAFNRRLRVAGIVLYQAPGHLIHIEEGGECLLVYSRDQTPLQPGDKIEAVGFLGREGERITLREAVYRKAEGFVPPVPQSIVLSRTVSPDLDGRLVRIEGTLLDSVTIGEQSHLTMQSAKVIFEANVGQATEPRTAAGPAGGSRLALVGIYEVKYDENGRPSGFQLQLRNRQDIFVLQDPPWLTRERILAVATALGLAIILFTGWVTALRRRVRAQTCQIRDQVRREAHLETELLRAGKLESLGLLAGGIAHDFNNLLTVVMGNVALVRLDSLLSPESAASLGDAEKAAFRARDLTQQLLTFAKGGAPLKAAVSLPDIIREIAEFALRGSKARCNFDIAADLWTANADKGQIGQVVQNLVINATQAMPDGGEIFIGLRNATIGADFGKVLAPGRYVLLTVADRGKGIRPEDLPKIFDPYFTTKKHGHGLGLATVYSIVKRHSGHIAAESKPGMGTSFRIWLPAAEATLEEVAKPLPDSVSPTSGAKRARVLVLDDEEQIRRLASSILLRLGHEVVTVSDGAEAIQTYSRGEQEKRPFDLLIMDLTIPGGVGGLQALQEIQRHKAGVRAIVSSGYSNDPVLSDYQAFGFRGMVSKPYNIADFSLAVDRVLRGERA